MLGGQSVLTVERNNNIFTWLGMARLVLQGAISPLDTFCDEKRSWLEPDQ